MMRLKSILFLASYILENDLFLDCLWHEKNTMMS